MEFKGRTTCSTVLLAEPMIYAGCLCILKDGEDVIVGVDESTDKFYKVWTESGVEGYCLRHQVIFDEGGGDNGRQHT